MQWLNYHHLLYFWTVAREGSVTAAARRLRLTQPTLSGQIGKLEDALGAPLFERRGRGLVLTEVGRTVYRYADAIFLLGTELVETLQGRQSGRPARLEVGVVDVMPKLVVASLLEPAWRSGGEVRIEVRERPIEQLLADLATHEIDVVLSDAPAPSSAVKVYSHLLGRCGVSFLAAPALASGLAAGFPHSLDSVPMLLPTSMTVLRRALDTWFEEIGIRPRVVGEFEDSALLKTVGQRGHGVFPAATAIEQDAVRQYGAIVVGRTERVEERFYAITVARRLEHPAVVALVDAARAGLNDPDLAPRLGSAERPAR